MVVDVMAVGESTASNYETRDPDVRLMLQVRDGSRTAFEALVERYQERLISVLELLVRQKDLAEDIAQEVFLRVYRARKTYLPNAKFCTWLFTIANNLASNARRYQSRRREINITGSDSRSVQPLDRMASAPSAWTPTRRMDSVERVEKVRLAIDELNERQRSALLLCKFEGMSYADIADNMGISCQAVKSLLARARNNLRVLLEPYMRDN